MSYPSQSAIKEQFQALASGDVDTFFAKVKADVDWTVMGTHPLAGRYHSAEQFKAETFGRLNVIMKPPGMQLAVRNVVGGGEHAWATVELVANAVCKNDFVFDNCYAWVVRYNKEGTIEEVRAYLDSWMVRESLVENESKHVKSSRAPVPRVSDL